MSPSSLIFSNKSLIFSLRFSNVKQFRRQNEDLHHIVKVIEMRYRDQIVTHIRTINIH